MKQDLPDGWSSVELADVVDVLDFERQPINATERSERTQGKALAALFAYYGATGQVGWIDQFRTEGQRVLLGEDAAPFFDPNKDKAYLANGHYWVNNHAHVLQGVIGALNNIFLCHQLNTVDFHPFVSGSTRLKLTSAAMKRIPLAVAPLREQTRIVDKLEELLSDLDAGVAELKAAQKKLAQYRQSLLKAAVEGRLTEAWRAQHGPETDSEESGAQLLARILRERRARWEAKQLTKFKAQGKAPPKGWQDKYEEPAAPSITGQYAIPMGWTWATVDQLSVEQKYGSSAKTAETDSGVPVIRMGNIQDGDLDLNKLKYLPTAHDEFPALFLVDGDMLFNRTNSPELVGKSAVYRSQISPCSYASYLIAVRFSPSVIPELVAGYINSGFGRQWVKSVVTQQVGQANVNGTKLAALTMPLPPFEEQVEIARVLSEQQMLAAEQSVNVAYALRQSAAQRKNILQSAFSGQLVPQDPNDEPASVLLARIRAERGAQSQAGGAGRRQRRVASE